MAKNGLKIQGCQSAKQAGIRKIAKQRGGEAGLPLGRCSILGTARGIADIRTGNRQLETGNGSDWIELPWPPSVNHYWKRGRNGGVFVSAAGKQFARDAYLLLRQKQLRRLVGPVTVSLVLAPPADGKKHDADNILKATLDVLKMAGVYVDDEQVAELYIRKIEAAGRGSLWVQFAELQHREHRDAG